jgi:hypothetical protein
MRPSRSGAAFDADAFAQKKAGRPRVDQAIEMDYVAYGLDLRSSFPLPGLVPRTGADLPSLRLDLLTSSELETAWSGADGPATWHGLLGDGLLLSAARGAAGDLLFAYGDRARFHLDPSMRLLACHPSRAGLDWQRVLLTKVLSCVSMMRGYEALHACAVDSPSGAVVIAGPGGAGKSTLALELMQRGWPLLADDVLALAAAEPGSVRAYPGTPHMNLVDGPSEAAAPPETARTLGVLAGERWIAARAPASEPRPLHAIFLLERSAGLPLAAHRLSPHPLPLAPYMLGLFDDAERARRRFALYADVASTTPLMRLTSDTADRLTDVADLIERAVTDRPMALAIGGAA